MLENLLLGGILVTLIAASFPRKWLPKKLRSYQHYGDKMEVTEKKRNDLEFLRRNLKEVREGQRLEYDRKKEILDAANLRLGKEKEKEDPDQTLKQSLEKMIDQHTQDTKNLETQMQALDTQIEGPEGVNTRIGNLNDVHELLRKHRQDVWHE